MVNNKPKKDLIYWFNYQNFYNTIANMGFSKLVEVGVWKGDSIAYLASETLKVNPKAKFWAVDLFNDSLTLAGEVIKKRYKIVVDRYNKSLYDVYNDKLIEVKVREFITDICGMSWEKADLFDDGSLDFVYIDADHSYESVYKDLRAWFPKVRSGGIFAGHDYSKSWLGVMKAVDEFFIEKDIKVNVEAGAVWWVNI